MFSTIILLAALSIFVIVDFFLCAYFLWLGARWTKIQGVTYRRALFAGVLVYIAQLVVWVPSLFFAPSDATSSLVLGIVQLAATAFTAVLILSMLFRVTLSRCLLAWLATLIPDVGLGALDHLVVQRFVVKPIVNVGNGMAPTLLGAHWEGVCPWCGRPTYCSPEESRGFSSGHPYWVICENFHSTKSAEHDKPVHPADHFLVNKLLKPHRWDVVVFRYPGDPEVLSVKRLVGLPGEVVTIQNGAVRINGRAISPPESLRGLKYVTELDGPDEVLGTLQRPVNLAHEIHIDLGGFFRDEPWGTPRHPAKLAVDEYFVLGDFSRASLDSRLFQSGAPGHPPYAIPASYLYGVVTHIYWPPSRWRAFR